MRKSLTRYRVWLPLLVALGPAQLVLAAPPRVLLIPPQYNGQGTQGDRPLLAALARALSLLGAEVIGVSAARWHPGCGPATSPGPAQRADGILGLWLEGAAVAERGRLWWTQVSSGLVAYQDFALRPGATAEQVSTQLALLWDALDGRLAPQDPLWASACQRAADPARPVAAAPLPLRLELSSEITPTASATTDADAKASAALQAALLLRLGQLGVQSPRAAPTGLAPPRARPLQVHLRLRGELLREIALSLPGEEPEIVPSAGRDADAVVHDVGVIVARAVDGWPQPGEAPRITACLPYVQPQCAAPKAESATPARVWPVPGARLRY